MKGCLGLDLFFPSKNLIVIKVFFIQILIGELALILEGLSLVIVCLWEIL